MSDHDGREHDEGGATAAEHDRIGQLLEQLPDEQLPWVVDLLERLLRSGKGSAFGRAGELLGYTLDDMRPGRAAVRFVDDGLYHHAGGVLMGGIVAGLVDHAMGAAVAPLLGDGELTATTDLTCRYLRPVRGGALVAAAEVVHEGRRSFQVRGEITADGELVALAEASFARVTNENEADPAWRTIAADARARAGTDDT